MANEHCCPHCGTTLGPDDPSGLCGRCLLEQGVAELHADAEELESALPRVNAETFGRYTCEREHARGGMGRILVAHDEQLDRDVVIKELLPDSHNGSKEAQLPSPFQRSWPVVARFLREARVTGQLQHPAIVPVYELGRREDGTLYYTMKQVQGISLSDAIRQADGLKDRLELLPHFLDLCQAVSYAHSRGVIHRDIKPANVMVGEFGETVLLDWGLAKLRGQEDLHERFMERSVQALEPGKPTDAVVSAFGQVLGTPVYMAPEQARGQSDRVDERTDVYALGAVLYTLSTGKPPFTGERSDEILAKVVNEEPLPILEVEREVPRALAAICHKAMAKSPEDRYGSATSLAHEVQRFLSGGLVAAYGYGLFDHLHRFVRRNQKAVVTAATAVLLLALLAGSSHIRVLVERNKAVAARQETEESLTLAETNLRLAESAVDDLLAEVSENDLINQPGMEPLRRKLLESALAYSEQITEQYPEGEGDAIRRTAEAQLRLGRIYNLLGQHEEALKAYRQARSGYAALGQTNPEAWEYQDRLATTLMEQGFVLIVTGKTEEALAAYEQARELRVALVEAHPEVPGFRFGLANVLGNLGSALSVIGKAEEALATLQQAHEMYAALVEAHPEEPRYRRNLAGTLSKLGVRLHHLGRAEEAFAAYEQARQGFATLVEGDPEEPKYRAGLAGVMNDLGFAFAEIGKTEEALAAYEQARQMREALVKAHPEVPEYRDGLATVLSNLGVVLKATGKSEEALASYEQARELRAALVDAHPEVPEYRNSLATVLINLGFVFAETGRAEEALAAWEQAREAYAALVDAHPEVPEYRNSLAIILNNLGVVLADTGKAEEALAAYEQAREAYVVMVEAHPEVPEYRNGLAMALNNLGIVFADTGKAEAALAACEQVRDTYAALVEAHPEVPEYRNGLAMVLMNQGIFLGSTGKVNEALAACEQARDAFAALVEAQPGVPEYRANLARALNNLGLAYSRQGQNEEALASYEQARKVYTALVEAHPEVPAYRDGLAWTYNGFALSIRKSDATRALEMATTAVEITERKDGNILDSLATILAESGQVEQAILTQREALEVLDDTKYPNKRGGVERRLGGYEARLEWDRNKDAQWDYLETTLRGKKIGDGLKGSWSPDGSKLLYVGTKSELNILDLSTGESSQVSEHAIDFGWSPDGRYIAWRTRNKQLWIAEPSGEGRRELGSGVYRGWSQDGRTVYGYSLEEQTIYAFDIDDADGAGEVFCDELSARVSSISPDGRRIVFTENETLWIVDRDTRETMFSWTASGTLNGLTAWSSDGTRLAFGGAPFSLGLWVVDLETDKAVQVIKGPCLAPAWSPDGSKLLFSCRGVDPPEIWMIETKALDELPRVTQPEEVDVAESTADLTAQ